ncbi:MAG: NADH-quinone oxidoreductase subunit L [Myxococcota bacterium]
MVATLLGAALPSSLPDLSGLAALAAIAVPLLFVLGAVLVPLGGRRALFERTERVASAALLFAALQGLATALSAPAARDAAADTLGLALALDAVTSVMLGLVAFMAFVIARYSRAYLGTERGGARYARWLLATLAAVTVLVVARDLLVMVFAWTAASLALHQLLTFFQERPQALVAAHKKFIVSRLADLALLSAAVLLQSSLGSLDLRDLGAIAGPLPAAAEAATFLLVLGTCLRTAQLPFHGWLTQVMEAPTPVSALLHAGVVNLGGFVMIRLAGLMEASPVAQAFLVVIAGTTAVVAALVMTTQVSVKVKLAWSTCAQMGFMMLQCGLGAYGLALLHLVAHSLYKAHAFLSSGSTVERTTVASLAPRRERAGAGRWLAAAALALAGVGAGATLGGFRVADEPALVPFLVVLALGLTPLLVRGAARGPGAAAMAGAVAFGVAALYAGWHGLFTGLVTPPATTLATLAPRLGLALLAVLVLFGLQVTLLAAPQSRLARALRPRLYAGLRLDERFTHLTFRIWPAPLPARHPGAVTVTVEAR